MKKSPHISGLAITTIFADCIHLSLYGTVDEMEMQNTRDSDLEPVAVRIEIHLIEPSFSGCHRRPLLIYEIFCAALSQMKIHCPSSDFMETGTRSVSEYLGDTLAYG